MSIQLCQHEVSPTIESPDYLSFIDARDGVMAQDIHLDSFVPGWSFLTTQEHNRGFLILWNGYKLVKLVNLISGDREAAASYVRRQVMASYKITISNDSNQSTVSHRPHIRASTLTV